MDEWDPEDEMDWLTGEYTYKRQKQKPSETIGKHEPFFMVREGKLFINVRFYHSGGDTNGKAGKEV
jgi:hypothetical protein